MINDFGDELTYTSGGSPSSKQSIVGNAGTAIVGGRVKDAGAGYTKDWASGELHRWIVRVVTAVAGASGGVQFDLVAADNAALTTNPVVLATRTIAAAALLINTLHALPIPNPGTRKRYFGLKVTPLTSNSTAGEIVVEAVPPEGVPQNEANSL